MPAEDVRQWIRDIRSRMPIDETDLIAECDNQPALYQEVSEVLEELRDTAKRGKARLKLEEAKILLLVRKSPKNYGLEKVSETTADATVKIQPEYQKTLSEQFDAEFNAGAVGGLMESIAQRKSMIRDMVQMAVSRLYSTEPMDRERHQLEQNERIQQVIEDRKRNAEERRKRKNTDG